MMRDQRHMSGPVQLETPEQVQQFWSDHGDQLEERVGYRFSERRDGVEFRQSQKHLQPVVNNDRWVATCPICNGGIALWQENDQAACLDCGTIYTRIDWPGDEDISVVEELFEQVLEPEHRNWDPSVETVEDVTTAIEENRDEVL